MKKFLPLLFAMLLLQTAKAQYIAVPDSNFLKFLKEKVPSCIAGNMLNISFAASINVTEMDCNRRSIADVTGIQYFTNLKEFRCNFNKLTTITALPPKLTWLDCGSNQITSLPALPDSLRILVCNYNKLTSLPALPALLGALVCDDNQLTSLPAFPDSLVNLQCRLNKLTSLPTLPYRFEFFDCPNNLLDSLPAIPATVTYLRCSDNKLKTLPALPTVLRHLHCGNNQITSLPTLPLSLVYFSCSNNQLTVLPAIPDTVRELGCSNNQLTTLPALPASLTMLEANDNRLTSLPALPQTLFSFRVANNPDLKCMPVLKKLSGTNTSYTFVISGTGIRCLPNFIEHPSPILALDTMPICDVYNNPNGCEIAWNIQGSIFGDNNNNCSLSVGEQIIARPVKVNLYQGATLVQSEYFGGGNYGFDAGAGTYRVEVDTTSLPFAVCPAGAVVTLTATDSISYGVNFGLQCKPGFDVGVKSVFGNLFRPGSNSHIKTVTGDMAKVLGMQCGARVGGILTIDLSGPVKFISAAQGASNPTTTSNKKVQWNVYDFRAVDAELAFNIIVGTETTGQIGQEVCFTVKITPEAGNAADYDSTNNILTQCFPVRTSFDPNDKQVYPAGNTDISTKWLTYTIRFQNTGNDTAIHIYVMDTLDSHVQASSFELLDYSHKPIVQWYEPGIVKFNFPNIMLADSNVNEPASHGYVQYRIKLKDELPLGTEIPNTAYIYFDFNAPVVTNTTVNTLVEKVVTGIGMPGNSNSVNLYPNPTSNLLYISTSGFTPQVTVVYDVNGRKISEQRYSTQIDVSALTNGIYFIEVKGGSEVVKVRFVKM